VRWGNIDEGEMARRRLTELWRGWAALPEGKRRGGLPGSGTHGAGGGVRTAERWSCWSGEAVGRVQSGRRSSSRVFRPGQGYGGGGERHGRQLKSAPGMASALEDGPLCVGLGTKR
jgi:hypothetical protein